MSANVLAAITPTFQIQRRHHHEPGIWVSVEIRTLFNGAFMSAFGGRGHVLIVACIPLKNAVQPCAR